MSTPFDRAARPPAALCLAVLLATSAGAATFTVNSSLDAPDATPGDDLCATSGGVCTLRAAVGEANSDAAADVVAVGIRSITLQGFNGPIVILQPLEIQGAGMRETVVAGGRATRVFEVAALDVFLEDLTIRDGTTGAGGGGILVTADGALNCNRCLIAHNHAGTNGGAGVLVEFSGTVNIKDSIIAGNEAAAGSGGAGLRVVGSGFLERTLIADNRSASNGGGLQITGSLAVHTSTLRDNVADAGGAASVSGSLQLFNSTVSSNRASFGGGVATTALAASVALDNATVVYNVADDVGGLSVAGTGNSMGHSIVALNVSHVNPSADCSGTFTTLGHNLIETTTGCAFTGDTSSHLTGVDPQLLPLGYYGGPTPTHELSSSSSPAFDAGGDVCNTQDQRGHPRPRGAHCDIGSTELYGFVPVAPVIDPAGNQVLEDDETVAFEPALRSLLAGTFAVSAGLTGLAGPPTGDFDYLVIDDEADYGSIPGGATRSCGEEGDCYALRVDQPAFFGFRPLRHWDVTATEEVTGGPLAVAWRLHVGGSFPDLPASHDAYRSGEALFHHGVTGGCSASSFCPDDPVTRRQAAVLLLRARHGELFVPAACDPPELAFDDLDAADPACGWMQEAAAEGILAGCDADRFCPDDVLQRRQAARVILKALHGADFEADICLGVNVDVAGADCPWVEDVLSAGIAEGCGAGTFCPLQPMTRQTLTLWIARAFALDVWSF